MRALLPLLLLVLLAPGTLRADQPAAAAGPAYTFGVVPQQAASKLARLWGPLLRRWSREAGVSLVFQTARDIPTFEQRMAEGRYDFAYMNPYHYTVFSQRPGYRAMARRSGQGIQGLLVVHKESPITRIDQLAGRQLAFPAPASFAATLLTQAHLREEGVAFTPHYVTSHDSVYRSVEKGLYPAGGGILRTLDSAEQAIRDNLRILWQSRRFTPHAVAHHPRVPAAVVERVRAALVATGGDAAGRVLLAQLKIPGLQAAEDREWDDVRALGITVLQGLTINPAAP